MKARYSRRKVSAALLGAVAGSLAGSRVVFAQTPETSSPVAVSGDALFAGVTLEEGVAPTIHGDVTLPATVERVVTITDGAVDAMTAVGVTPVGVTASSNFESVAAYLEGQVSGDVAYVGGWSELDIEAIIGLNPDLILADRYVADDQYVLLSDVAPVIATGEIEVPGPADLQQWEYELLVWGHAVGKLPEAKEAILGLRERAARMQASAGERVGESVVVFRPQPDFPVVMSHAWITGVMLTWAGFRGNELTERTPPPHSGNSVSLEQLNLLDADWLLAATRNEEMSAALESYLENPVFQSLTAVEEGSIVQVSGDLWSGATGVLAGHAMLDDIERILIDGDTGR